MEQVNENQLADKREMNLTLELEERFGKDNVKELSVAEGEIPLLLITIPFTNPVQVLMTNGLSNYQMPVPEKLSNRAYNELYFCLPSYWDLEDKENPTMNWIFYWIQRLSNYVVEKKTWFGTGHTMPCGNPFQSLSPTMFQNHFFLNDPMLLKDELTPLEKDGKTIHFLCIIPIFSDEMDYKQGKGTYKLIKKLQSNGITEKLDDYRGNVLKSKWRMIRR